MKKIIVLVMCTYVVGCRLLLDVDKLQCEEDVQCADQFGSEYVCGEQGVCQKSGKANQDASTDMMGDAGVKLEKRFACINEPATIPAKPKSGKVHLDVQIVDFLSLAPAADVLLNACGVRDSMCSSPLFKDVALDAKGFASLDLPYGFDGFFEAGGGGYVPALFAINRPQYEDLSLAGPSLLTDSGLQALAATNQDTLQSGTGVVVVEIVDCNGDAAEGVSIEMEGLPDLKTFYIDGNLPNLNLTSTRISTGLSAGMLPRAVGGFTNVAPGFQTVHATLESLQVSYARASIIVRPDTMTFVRLYPGAAQ